MNLIIRFFLFFQCVTHILSAAVVGGRPNAFSGGKNAFAGTINSASGVWLSDRIDAGGFWQHQKSSFGNPDLNPRFGPDKKVNTNYRLNDFFVFDIALNKIFKIPFKGTEYPASLSLAAYSTPPFMRQRTKNPLPISGNSPIRREEGVNVISAIFAMKLTPNFSAGFSLDYYRFKHLRNGFQNSDNPIRSVRPGYVTNNGRDHSEGLGLGVGIRWKLTEKLFFGAAWSRKTNCGNFRKYRGYEPQYALNFQPETFGSGVSYKFSEKITGRVEALWVDLGNTPNSNDAVFPNGQLNMNKRGSRKAPSPALRDITSIMGGLGYKLNELVSFGIGYSHRLKPAPRSSQIIAHILTCQTIQDQISTIIDLKFKKIEVLVGYSHGFKNKITGPIPEALGPGKLSTQKVTNIMSLSIGYLY